MRGGDGNSGVRDSVEHFSELRMALPGENAGGKTVPLAELARIERLEGPVKVDRENAQRYVVIQSNVRGRDLVGFVEEAKLGVAAQLHIPPGYRLVWGGQFENQQRAAQRLSLVVPVALALIFLILFRRSAQSGRRRWCSPTSPSPWSAAFLRCSSPAIGV